MDKSSEKSMNSSTASGNLINSKLRYPLRSALKSKEGKPPVPDFTGSSGPKRARVVSAVSQSTTVLDLSGKKSVDRTKPPRRLSIPTKGAGNSSSKSVCSSVTTLSESKVKRSGAGNSSSKSVCSSINNLSEIKVKRSSGNARGVNETPVVSSVLRSVNRRKLEDLSSSTYWLSHIKLSESVAKHSISLGFFKLALDAKCEPLDEMKEELKSYTRRNNLDGLADAIKELSELYNISEEPKQLQISETCSVVAGETTLSVNNDIQNSFSTPENLSMASEVSKDDTVQGSAIIGTAKEEASETIPQEMTKGSLDVIDVNPKDVPKVQESEEGSRSSEDGTQSVTVPQPSNKKRANRIETVSKNNQPMKARKSTANSTNSRTVPENRADKSQKKAEKIVTKPRNKKNQQQKHETKKPTKKSAAAKEDEVKSPKQMKTTENKENTELKTNTNSVVAGEEIQV